MFLMNLWAKLEKLCHCQHFFPHFSSILRSWSWPLKPFLKPRWYFKRILSINDVICLRMNFSNKLEITERILTGRLLSLEPLNSFLSVVQYIPLSLFKKLNFPPVLMFLIVSLIGCFVYPIFKNCFQNWMGNIHQLVAHSH